MAVNPDLRKKPRRPVTSTLAMTTALPSVVILSRSRQARMTEELLHALRLIPREQLTQWGADSGVLFGKVIKPAI